MPPRHGQHAGVYSDRESCRAQSRWSRGCGGRWPACRCRAGMTAGSGWRDVVSNGCGPEAGPARTGMFMPLLRARHEEREDGSRAGPYSFVAALEPETTYWTMTTGLDAVRLLGPARLRKRTW